MPSIDFVGDSYDNALAETVNSLYKTEQCRQQGPLQSVDDVELATLSWAYCLSPSGSTARSTTSPDPA